MLKQYLPAGLRLLAVIIILSAALLPFKGFAGATDRHPVYTGSPDVNNGDISPSSREVPIGFIGDSITAGLYVPQSKNAVTGEIADLGNDFKAVNAGVSGTTTADWQPGGADLRNALDAFRTGKVQVVSIMLGTNDSKDSVATTPATYRANLNNIVNAVRAAGIENVIIEYPPYLVPDNDKWSANSQKLLQEYQGSIDSLVNGKTIVQGDTDAWDYFDAHRNELRDGVHPTAEGYADLGQLWANAFTRNFSVALMK